MLLVVFGEALLQQVGGVNMNFKPMLASQIDDLSSVKYPVYASYKLDGIRNEIDFKE